MFGPWLIPDTMRCGRAAFITWLMATYEQSVGVPSTAYQRSRTWRMRSGRCSEIACEAALCSASGATTQISPSGVTASTSVLRPSDW